MPSRTAVSAARAPAKARLAAKPAKPAKAAKSARPSAAPEKKRRQRLAPEARASQILDCAARLILDEGFTEVSMERLGREAGISKALIYNYFPNRNDLLRALLERELDVLRARQIGEVRASENFGDLVRRTTRIYVQHVKERGALLQRLWAETTVARSVAEKHLDSREEAMRYFAHRVSREYQLPADVALSAVDMQMAMTEAAAQHLSRSHGDVDFATDICVTLLLGGMDALAKVHGASKAKAKSASSSKTTKPAAPGKVARAAKKKRPA